MTAVLFGTPEWARPVNTSRAKNVSLVDEKFIAPDTAKTLRVLQECWPSDLTALMAMAV